MLDANTFTNQKVIKIIENNIIPKKINAGTKIGNELFETYKGRAYPLIIFLDHNKIEIDRFYGYLEPDSFIEKVENVLSEKKTYKTYYSNYIDGNKSAETLSALAQKCQDRGDDSLAFILYNELLLKNNLSLQDFHLAKFSISTLKMKENDISYLLEYLDTYPNSPHLENSIYKLSDYYKKMNLINDEKQLYNQYINNFLSNSSFLNMYAWRLSELNYNLDDALEKIELGINVIDKSDNSYPYLLDTKAEILWKLNRKEEAIMIINTALKIDPDNEYYKNQKIKFTK